MTSIYCRQLEDLQEIVEGLRDRALSMAFLPEVAAYERRLSYLARAIAQEQQAEQRREAA